VNKSLEQRVRILENRLAELERQATIRHEPVVTITPVGLEALHKMEEKIEKPTRAMCPKCGVKPNYFFHVKTCTGQKDGDKATDRRRDQS
jgi:hypothetical protein